MNYPQDPITVDPISQIHPELVERLRLCRWPGRQFGYSDVLEQVYRTLPRTLAPQMSVVIDVTQPDKQAIIGLTMLAAQTECPVQLIVVDNASGSPLAAMLLEKAHVGIRLRRQVSAHIARNLGAIFADTPWLIFLSDKIRPLPDLPAQFLQCLTTHNALAARGDILGVDDESGSVFTQLARKLIPHPWPADLFENMAVRAENFYRAGGFDEGMEAGGALDLSIRLFAQQPDAATQRYCPTAIAMAGDSFDIVAFMLQRQHDWAVLMSTTRTAIISYGVYWLGILCNLEGAEQ